MRQSPQSVFHKYLLPSPLRQRQSLKKPHAGADTSLRTLFRVAPQIFELPFLHLSRFFREINFSHPTPDVVFQEQTHYLNVAQLRPFKGLFPWTRAQVAGAEAGDLLVATSP